MVQEKQEAPKGVRDEMMAALQANTWNDAGDVFGRFKRIKGFTSAQDGQVYVFLDNQASPYEMQNTLQHEGLHQGLMDVFRGDREQLNAALQAMAQEPELPEWLRRGAAQANGNPRYFEELLAQAAESVNTEPGMMRSLALAFQRAVGRGGAVASMKEGDVQTLLFEAFRARRMEPYRAQRGNLQAQAAEVAMPEASIPPVKDVGGNVAGKAEPSHIETQTELIPQVKAGTERAEGQPQEREAKPEAVSARARARNIVSEAELEALGILEPDEAEPAQQKEETPREDTDVSGSAIEENNSADDEKPSIPEATQQPAQGRGARSVAEMILDRNAKVERVPVAALHVNERIAQFKRGADPKTGVVPGNRLSGEYAPTIGRPIRVMQFDDGHLEVITGRHRLDLAKQNRLEEIPAIVYRETDGMTVEKARALDSAENVMDGKGSTQDYIRFFRDTDLSREDLAALGLSKSESPRVRDAYALATNAIEDVRAFALDANTGGLPISTLGAIAQCEPAVQRALLDAALKKGVRDPAALRMMGNALANGFHDESGEQADLFGADDAALEESRLLGLGQAAIARELQNDRAAISGVMHHDKTATIRREAARRLRITDPNSREQLQRAYDRLGEEIAVWTSPTISGEKREQALVRGREIDRKRGAKQETFDFSRQEEPAAKKAEPKTRAQTQTAVETVEAETSRTAKRAEVEPSNPQVQAERNSKEWSNFGNESLQQVISRVGADTLRGMASRVQAGEGVAEVLGETANEIFDVLRDYYRKLNEPVLQKLSAKRHWTDAELEEKRQGMLERSMKNNVSLFTLENVLRSAVSMLDGGGKTEHEIDRKTTPEQLRQADGETSVQGVKTEREAHAEGAVGETSPQTGSEAGGKSADEPKPGTADRLPGGQGQTAGQTATRNDFEDYLNTFKQKMVRGRVKKTLEQNRRHFWIERMAAKPNMTAQVKKLSPSASAMEAFEKRLREFLDKGAFNFNIVLRDINRSIGEPFRPYWGIPEVKGLVEKVKATDAAGDRAGKMAAFRSLQAAIVKAFRENAGKTEYRIEEKGADEYYSVTKGEFDYFNWLQTREEGAQEKPVVQEKQDAPRQETVSEKVHLTAEQAAALQDVEQVLTDVGLLREARRKNKNRSDGQIRSRKISHTDASPKLNPGTTPSVQQNDARIVTKRIRDVQEKVAFLEKIQKTLRVPALRGGTIAVAPGNVIVSVASILGLKRGSATSWYGSFNPSEAPEEARQLRMSNHPVNVRRVELAGNERTFSLIVQPRYAITQPLPATRRVITEYRYDRRTMDEARIRAFVGDVAELLRTGQEAFYALSVKYGEGHVPPYDWADPTDYGESGVPTPLRDKMDTAKTADPEGQTPAGAGVPGMLREAAMAGTGVFGNGESAEEVAGRIAALRRVNFKSLASRPGAVKDALDGWNRSQTHAGKRASARAVYDALGESGHSIQLPDGNVLTLTLNGLESVFSHMHAKNGALARARADFLLNLPVFANEAVKFYEEMKGGKRYANYTAKVTYNGQPWFAIVTTMYDPKNGMTVLNDVNAMPDTEKGRHSSENRRSAKVPVGRSQEDAGAFSSDYSTGHEGTESRTPLTTKSVLQHILNTQEKSSGMLREGEQEGEGSDRERLEAHLQRRREALPKSGVARAREKVQQALRRNPDESRAAWRKRKAKAIASFVSEKMIDARQPIIDAVKEIAGDEKLDESMDIPLAMQTSYGHVFAEHLAIDQTYVNPVLSLLSEHGLQIEELDAYLMAKFAPERNRMIAERTQTKRNPAGNLSGSGLTDEAAASLLRGLQEKLSPEQFAALGAAAEKVYAMNRATLERLVSYGVMAKEQAGVWLKKSSHYVPLRDDYEALGIEMPGGNSMGGRPYARAVGRFSEANTSQFAWSILQAKQGVMWERWRRGRDSNPRSPLLNSAI